MFQCYIFIFYDKIPILIVCLPTCIFLKNNYHINCKKFPCHLTMTNFYGETCGIHKVGSPLQLNFFHMQESNVKSLNTCLGTSYIPCLLNQKTRSNVILVRLHFCETIPQARKPISHRGPKSLLVGLI
jgi:hypothetical protein